MRQIVDHSTTLLGMLLTAFLPACAPEQQTTPPPATGQPEKRSQNPKTDLYGDPLPPGAIARMGMVRFRHDGGVRTLIYSPDGKTLVSGSWGNICLWEAATGKELQTLINQGGFLALSPDGKTMATLHFYRRGAICLLETGSGKILLKIGGHESRVLSAAFSPDGKTLASGSEDQTIRLWETSQVEGYLTKERLKIDVHGAVYSVAFAPDGKTLATGSDDETIRLWETATGKELLVLAGHRRAVRSVAYSPDGKMLASCSDDMSIRLWDAATGKELLRVEGNGRGFPSTAFSPDGKTLVSAYDDETIRFGDVRTGEEYRKSVVPRGVGPIAFSPDGKTLASGSKDLTILIWDVAALLKDRK